MGWRPPSVTGEECHMNAELRLEPESLYHVGRVLYVGAGDGQESFARDHDALSAAADGLFRRARSAMHTKSEAWRSSTDALINRMDDHGVGLHRSAAAFELADSNNAGEIDLARDHAPELRL